MRKNKRKIAVLTGARAEYGLLRPVMLQIIQCDDLKLLTLVTGSHLNKNSGYTFKDIILDGFVIDDKISMYPNKDLFDGDIPLFLSEGLKGITRALNRLRPDILLILGDRGEALMAAIAATYLNIPIAHIHGGDQCTGADIDDNIRHAITKLAHIHFPATRKSAERIMGMGEEKWRIHTVGAPGLDSILNDKCPPAIKIAAMLDLDLNKEIILLLQHAVSSETKEVERQIEETMKAIVGLKFQTVVLYPNIDPGNISIIKVIKKYNKFPFIKTRASLPHNIFLGLMRLSSVMVGNSSSAIIEAPSFKLPVVNIGIRQMNRERSNNIIDVGHNRAEIKRAVLKAIKDKKFRRRILKCKNPYGDGKASIRIINELRNIRLDKRLLCKAFILK